jgi:hypothetical protein
MKYKEFKAPKAFWKQFYRLPPEQQAIAREKFKIFRQDPFASSLRAHRIARLSSALGRTVFAVDIEGDLRSTFYLDGDTVMSVSIGTHDIYK